MNTNKPTQFLVIILLTIVISLPSWGQNQRKPASKLNFSRFSVTADNKRISIFWSIENAASTNYFEIQKSMDGISFKTVALVLGPDPKQPAGDSYYCFDKYVRKNAKHFYYRLKHVDTNGDEQLSDTKLLAKL